MSRGSHVDATWHSGPCGSAMRAHAAPTWRESIFCILFILHLVVSIVHITFRLSEGKANPIIRRVL